ncbi:MAG: large conductance mechanosensitive channel [Flavobacteriaceae bacterium]
MATEKLKFKNMKKIFKEFKTFAIKGNMIDMSVGIVIGVAFGTVIKSLVDDVLMPIVSGIFKSPDFSNLFMILRMPTIEGIDMTSISAIRSAGGVALGYGLFINALLAFAIVSFGLFVVIKGINRLKREEDDKPKETYKPSREELILSDIRDILKK